MRNSRGKAKFTIRPATVDDMRAVWQIFQDSPEAAVWSEGAIRTSLLDSQTIALVGCRGDEVSGSIFGVSVAGEAEILNLAVSRKHRRQGLARGLVRKLLEEFASESVQRIFLEVRESNAAAIRLYEGLRFQRAGRRKGYYYEPEEDALVLERVISQ